MKPFNDNKVAQVFTCPECGKKWTEWWDPDDEWFGLALNQTLCEKCGKAVLRRIKEKWDNEDGMR